MLPVFDIVFFVGFCVFTCFCVCVLVCLPYLTSLHAWFCSLEREEQQPPAVPPPPSSSSMNSFAVSASLSASSPSLYSPPDSNYPTLKRQSAVDDGVSTLPRTHQAKGQAYRDPTKENLQSQSLKETAPLPRYAPLPQDRNAEIRPHVPPPPPRFAVLNFPASQEKIDHKRSPSSSRQPGVSSDNQASMYASSPALFDSTSRAEQQPSSAPSGNIRGLVGSYEQLYGRRSPSQPGRDNQLMSDRQPGNFQGLYGSSPTMPHKSQAPYGSPQANTPSHVSNDGPGIAPIPPQRHSSSSAGGGAGGVLDSWRDRNRATAAQQLAVKSPASGRTVSPKGIPV